MTVTLSDKKNLANQGGGGGYGGRGGGARPGGWGSQ
jgi:hypothetical protein